VVLLAIQTEDNQRWQQRAGLRQWQDLEWILAGRKNPRAQDLVYQLEFEPNIWYRLSIRERAALTNVYKPVYNNP
jgi:hypothetical protein